MLRSILTVLVMCLIWSAAPAQNPTHTVRAGETLFSISREYDVTVQQLREWNNLSDNTIRVGQRLVVRLVDDSETPSPETTGETITHTVEAGQTLFRISRMYDVSVDDIKSWNNLVDNTISIGQQLTIRTGSPPPREQIAQTPERPQPADSDPDREDTVVITEDDDERDYREAEGPAFYEVRPNDTMYRIATMFNMSVDDLKELNELEDTRLYVGQELRVRTRPSAPPSITAEWDMESSPQGRFVSYTIGEQDSIHQLLQYHNMDRYEFRALNPGVSLSDIRPGDEVTLLLAATSSQRNPYRIQSSDQSSSKMQVSRYPDSQRGKTTTSGDLYNPGELTAAHPSLSLGSVVYVENPDNGYGVFLLINDRTSENRLLLSDAAFQALNYSDATRLLAEIHD